MKKNLDPLVNQEELAASLARLGIKELEERMEVSPLLAAPDTEVFDRCFCETCCSNIELPKPYDYPGLDPYLMR
jgi:hypothetical protein